MGISLNVQPRDVILVRIDCVSTTVLLIGGLGESDGIALTKTLFNQFHRYCSVSMGNLSNCFRFSTIAKKEFVPSVINFQLESEPIVARSEERRVGKECRS